MYGTITKSVRRTKRPTQTLYQQLARIWRSAIRAFVEEALNNIHVETGMAGASLKPLAAEVRAKKALSASLKGMGPRLNKRSPKIYTPGKSHGPWPGAGQIQSQKLGEYAGSQKAYSIELGTQMNPAMRFSFSIPVFHWYLHEFGLANSPAWAACEKGDTAFEAAILEGMGGLDLTEYVFGDR